MKRQVFILSLIVLEAQALAHEERPSLSTNPVDWLLPGLAYVLPGMIAAVFLNHFVSSLNLALRTVLAVIFPMIFWFVFLYFLWSPERSFFELLLVLPLAVLSSKPLILIFVPSGIVIAAASFLDHRRRKIAEHSEVYSDL